MPKLWQLGEADGSGPWYLEDLRPHLTPASPRPKFQADKPLSDGTSATETYSFPSEGEVAGGETCNTLAEDWAPLVGNSAWSDAILHTSDGQVPIHSLVLRVRCPNLDLTELEAPCRQATKTALLSILRFIYTGKLGEVQLSDVEHVKQLGTSFRRADLISYLRARLTANNDSSGDDIIPSSITPKTSTQEMVSVSIPGGFTLTEPIAPKPVESSTNAKPVNGSGEADEADTVPVPNELVDLVADEYRPFQPSRGVQGSEVVDLTQSGCASPRSCNSDPAERSYWALVRRDLDQELRDEQEMEEDRREHARELAKIQSFIDQRSSQIQDVGDDQEVDRREMEKIYNLSRSSNNPEVDLFADNQEVEEVPISPKPSAEVIEVSSGSERGNFDDSTDEEVTPLVSKPEHRMDESFDIPIFESPECVDFIDYQRVLDTSLASQSLVAAAVSPRTPRKVLGSAVKSATTSTITSTGKTEEHVTEGGSPAALPEPEASCLLYPTTPLSTSAEIVESPEVGF